MIIGPCSIHDTDAALEYARRLQGMRERYQPQLEIVMRTYFEKPRTVVGWKGLISDPDLNGSYRSTTELSWRGACCCRLMSWGYRRPPSFSIW